VLITLGATVDLTDIARLGGVEGREVAVDLAAVSTGTGHPAGDRDLPAEAAVFVGGDDLVIEPPHRPAEFLVLLLVRGERDRDGAVRCITGAIDGYHRVDGEVLGRGDRQLGLRGLFGFGDLV